MPSLSTSAGPRIEIIPADDSLGHCPTLRVDGVYWHDPVQPYTEVLPLEGRRPSVVAAFGAGLGYTLAGARHLSPGSRLIAFEPVSGLDERARAWLREEWGIDREAWVEGDLADFQARLLEACRDRDSLAVIQLESAAARYPEQLDRFLDIVQQVVDAGTLTLPPRRGGEEKWEHLLGGLRSAAARPLLRDSAGRWAGQTALLLAGGSGIDDAAAFQAQGPIATVPERVGELIRRGLHPDLVVVGRSSPPSEELVHALTGCTLAVTPDSHPAWWGITGCEILVMAHNGCDWLVDHDDPARITSFRFGDELPLAIAAITLGARRLVTAGFEPSADADWNHLAASRRRDRAIGRIASSSDVECIASVDQLPAQSDRPAPPPPIPPRTLAERLPDALLRARRGLRVLRREMEQYSSADPARLAAFLERRAEAGRFTRAFFLQTPLPSAGGPIETWRTQVERAEALLDAVTTCSERAVESAPSILSRGAGSGSELRIFIGRNSREQVPAEILRHQLLRLGADEQRIEWLDAAVRSRFPAAAECSSLVQRLLIPALCDGRGRALYLEPNLLLFDSVSRLARLEMGGHCALVPREGLPSLMLVDCGASRWSPAEVIAAADRDPSGLLAWLRPTEGSGVGELPSEWGCRDELPLEAASMRFTCQPWLPWNNDLHPLSWAWRFFFDLSREEARLDQALLEAAVVSGEIDPSLALGGPRAASAASGGDPVTGAHSRHLVR